MEESPLILELLQEVLGDINAHYPNKGQISFDCPVCSYDIKGLDTQLIKKWGIKLGIHKGQALYIPTEWYYFYETTNEDCLLAHMECDSYSTVVYNYLRKK